MGGIGQGLLEAIIFLAIIAFLIGGGIVKGIDWFLDKDYIESKTILTPQKKLIINNNKVDTIYIYK